MSVRFKLIRQRIDRALLSLEPSQEPWTKDRTVLSRLIIALNTLASECSVLKANTTEEQRDFLSQTADLLWSIGEKAAIIDPTLDMADEKRR